MFSMKSNFLPVAEARRALESRYGPLIPEPEFRTNGPSTYYRIAGRDQRIGFIGAMSNLHFCESCNKLRLTCDGKLRPCLGSYLEFDIMKVMRAGANDAELKRFFLDVVERKPEQHDFRDELPAGTNDGGNRRMRESVGANTNVQRRIGRSDGTMKRLTHIGTDGSAQMVDVSAKEQRAERRSRRENSALRQETLDLISKNQIGKGNVFATARIAGIQAAKQTSQLIPLCHNLQPEPRRRSRSQHPDQGWK